MVRRTAARAPRGRGTQGTGSKRQVSSDDEVPEVYRDMLRDAEARDPEQFSSTQPVKKRRFADTRAIPVGSETAIQTNLTSVPNLDPVREVQTLSESPTEDEESGIEWEDVPIVQPAQGPLSLANESYDKNEPLVITFDQDAGAKKQSGPKWRPLTTTEKELRLNVHKTHLLCLLAHVNMRNRWCNDPQLQTFLRSMVPKDVIRLLHPPAAKLGYQKSVSFMNGLNEVADIFSKRFRVTYPGLRRSHWADNETQRKQKMESIMLEGEMISSRDDFRSQGETMQGSRDFGAQLFCALLRSLTIEARIICSLQPLPLGGSVKPDTTPEETNSQSTVPPDKNTSPVDSQKNMSEPPAPSRSRRIGRPTFRPGPTRPSSTRSKKTSKEILHDSPCPVFWVEAWNEGAGKWIVVDPVVTKTLAKPERMEPSAKDPYNAMTYVVAFDDGAYVRDVTCRYTKAFNAKTRKNRVENKKGGAKWWHDALSVLEKPILEAHDEADIKELAALLEAEPMPKNIQDYLNHPVYALERHLRHNQAFYPVGRKIGSVGLSKATSNSDKLEPVYRRSDVHTVRAARRWYLLGRDVKVGEQPLKHIPRRNKSQQHTSDDEDGETALYAEFQTELYRAPPVVRGIVPKNAFGNLDLFVPSMTPPGAVHIKHKDALRAALILGIDHARAVTGFDFQSRPGVGTALVNGIVIAEEFQEAIEEVLRGLEDEREQEALEARSEEVLRLWRLFLLKLRISERVKEYASDNEEAEDPLEQNLDIDPAERGGFLPEEGGGFLPEEGGGGFLPETAALMPSPSRDVQMELEAQDSTSNVEIGGLVRDRGKSRRGIRDTEGGSTVDEPLEVAKDNSVAISSKLPSASQQIPKKRIGKVPHYNLIVVPKKSDQSPKSSPPPKKPSSMGLYGSAEDPTAAVDNPIYDGNTASANKDSQVHLNQSVREPVQSPKLAVSSSDSEIEKGSLMSEDPEDEDAIPDWLV
ncbi:hypothetical protein N7468_007071 [Penicillium chermesinum]|uniref:DNA repair protein Rad4 n=1 Tax=Penicillium chermesinum TaxID=63820 RepID=A0A9W9TK73_9EURO|nr:uncharacterized protein N7468_007071 [Penicillium chermesinum]KAJ5225846.1 hypothetical protein N7468_007071 [Penicillium chermesinum]KAJ6160948.1 hypothetical protein N7470_004344 [Penicillium chermesinum]